MDQDVNLVQLQSTCYKDLVSFMATVEKINQKSRAVMTRKAVTTSGRKLEKSEIESHRCSGGVHL